MNDPEHRPRACVLSIGDELLRGAHADLNAPFLLSELGAMGFELRSTRLVSDDEEPLRRAMTELCSGADVVVSSGGLGPTLDDVTRDAAAAAAGVELVEAPGVFKAIEERFALRGRVAPESNRRQAMLPAGAKLLPNDHGTAPGFAVRIGTCLLVCLPGPPRELQPMWGEVLKPLLRERHARLPIRSERTFHLAGLSESIFAEQCGDWMSREADPLIGVSAKEGILTAHLVSSGSKPGEGGALEARALAFRERFEPWILFEGRGSLEARVVERLAEEGLKVAVAESCTGGRIASRLTGVAGSSGVFGAGWVTYANEIKHRQLNVAWELLETHGAVSSQVAAAMARGAAQASGADLAVSVTGIAGPGGGSAEKPVGLVWFGLAMGTRWGAEQVWTFERRFPGLDRDRVQSFATRMALELVLRAVDEKLGDQGGLLG